MTVAPAASGGPQPVALKTRRYLLQTLSGNSAPIAFQRWSQDPRMMGPMNLPARSLTAGQVRDYWASFDNHNRFFFGISDAAAGTPIGFWLVECEAQHEVATFHLGVDPAFWRSGCGLETAIALFDWLFAVRKIAKLNVLTLPGNTAMRGLLARLGFTEEGLLRQEVRNLTGEGRLDQLRFALLPNDWRAARQHLTAIQEK